MFQDKEFGVYHSQFLFQKDNKVLIDDDIFENIAKIYEKEDQIVGFQTTLRDS